MCTAVLSPFSVSALGHEAPHPLRTNLPLGLSLCMLKRGTERVRGRPPVSYTHLRAPETSAHL
eukprot:2845372-Alexandrium_andersonii.AAC.1